MNLRYQKFEPTIADDFDLARIPFTVPDVFRAQYFLDALMSASQPLFRLLSHGGFASTTPEMLLKDFFSSLVQELDQIILPVVVHEVTIARKMGLLIGRSSRARYESFFINGSSYSQLAKGLLWRYPELFAMITSVIEQTLNSICACFSHLKQDFALLVERGVIKK